MWRLRPLTSGCRAFTQYLYFARKDSAVRGGSNCKVWHAQRVSLSMREKPRIVAYYYLVVGVALGMVLCALGLAGDIEQVAASDLIELAIGFDLA